MSMSRWCYLTISSSAAPFSCPQSFPSLESFSVSCLFPSGGQSIRASASVFPMNIHSWFPLGSTALISLLSKGLSRTSLAPQFKSINYLALSLLYGPTLTPIHDYWKKHSFDYVTFVSKVMSLFFNTLSRFVIAFLPRSKRLLISWLQSPSTVIFGAQKNKVSHCFPIYLPWSDGTRCHDLHFLNVEL